MSEPALLKPITERSPVLRFSVWLLSWRILRRVAIGLVCLAVLTALFYSEENWRGARTEIAYRRTLEAKGRILDYTRLLPPSVLDEQNFANTPFFEPLFDFKPGTQTARDTNACKRTMDFAKDFSATALKDGWPLGRRVDLAACATGLEKSQSSAAEQINLPTNAMSRTQAAAAILDGLKKHDVVLDELRVAARRPHCRFNIYYELDDPAAILVPHLATIKRICQILELRALAELELGKTQSAAEDIALIFYLWISPRATGSGSCRKSKLLSAAPVHLGRKPAFERQSPEGTSR